MSSLFIFNQPKLRYTRASSGGDDVIECQHRHMTNKWTFSTDWRCCNFLALAVGVSWIWAIHPVECVWHLLGHSHPRSLWQFSHLYSLFMSASTGVIDKFKQICFVFWLGIFEMELGVINDDRPFWPRGLMDNSKLHRRLLCVIKMSISKTTRHSNYRKLNAFTTFCRFKKNISAHRISTVRWLTFYFF